MTEEEKSQKVVKVNMVIASGVASAVAALFTSKLGVAGTLIGAALTAMTINLGSAILGAQIEKASTKISGLPNTVRGRFSTQQIHIPGKQSPEPNPEPAARVSLFARLRSIPANLKEMTPSKRRRVLLGGVLAGLVATLIGLAAVTGAEATAGETLSCLVWRDCQQEESAASDETRGTRTSIGSFFASSPTPGTQVSPSGDPSGEQQVSPGNGQETPQQPAGVPAQPGDDTPSPQPNGAPQQPGTPPKQGVEPPAQPDAEPGTDGEAQPTPTPPPSDEAPEKGQGPADGKSKIGQEKEDREPGPL